MVFKRYRKKFKKKVLDYAQDLQKKTVKLESPEVCIRCEGPHYQYMQQKETRDLLIQRLSNTGHDDDRELALKFMNICIYCIYRSKEYVGAKKIIIKGMKIKGQGKDGSVWKD